MSERPTELNEKGFIFIGADGNPYRCCIWGDSPWLFKWRNSEHQWESVRRLTQMDVWMLPHNLSEEQQEHYHGLEAKATAKLMPAAHTEAHASVAPDSDESSMVTTVEDEWRRANLGSSQAHENPLSAPLKNWKERAINAEAQSARLEDALTTNTQVIHGLLTWMRDFLRCWDDEDEEALEFCVKEAREMVKAADEDIKIAASGREGKS